MHGLPSTVRLMTKPTPGQIRTAKATAAATAARLRRAEEKAAQRLRDAGWLVFDPAHLPVIREDFTEELEEGTLECALAEQGYLCVRGQRLAELRAATAPESKVQP